MLAVMRHENVRADPDDKDKYAERDRKERFGEAKTDDVARKEYQRRRE
jgi:hypothetical protein